MSECKHRGTTGREEEREGEGRSIIAAEWAPPAGKGNNQHCRGKAEIRRVKKDWSQRERQRSQQQICTSRGGSARWMWPRRTGGGEGGNQHSAADREPTATPPRPTDRGAAGQLSTSEIIIRPCARGPSPPKLRGKTKASAIRDEDRVRRTVSRSHSS